MQGPGECVPKSDLLCSSETKTLATISRVAVPKPNKGCDCLALLFCTPRPDWTSYDPGAGFCWLGFVFPEKRSELPKTHCGAEAFEPSVWVPTAGRSEYASGDGVTLEGGASLACSCDMKTLAA